jgi:hypothetical protein
MPAAKKVRADGSSPAKSKRPGPLKPEPAVVIHVTVKNTPPDPARLAAQREAVETIMAAIIRH